MKYTVRIVCIIVLSVMSYFVWIGYAKSEEERVCLPRSNAIEQLSKQFKEKAIGRGLNNDGNIMLELYVSESGSWTVMLTNTKNVACLVASGESWTIIPMLKGKGT